MSNNDLLRSMFPEEKAAAIRFCDCCEDFDAGGYDVPSTMMKRLAGIGLVKHRGGGWYEGTDLLTSIEDDLRLELNATIEVPLKEALTHLLGDTKSGESKITATHGFTNALNRKKNEYLAALSQLIPNFPLCTIENLADHIEEAKAAVLKARLGGTLTAEGRKLVATTSLLVGEPLLAIPLRHPEPDYPDFPSARVLLEQQKGDIIKAARSMTEYVKAFTLSDTEIFSDAIRVAEEAFVQYQQGIGKATRDRFDGLFFREWFRFIQIQYLRDDYVGHKGHLIEPGLAEFWKEINGIPSLKKHKPLIEGLLKVLDLYTACPSVVLGKQDPSANTPEAYKLLAGVPLWQHSIGVAKEALLQAKKYKVPLGDAVVAALAHDIGKLPKGMRWHREEDEDNIALVGHAKLSSQRFLEIPGSMLAKHPFNTRDGIAEHHASNPVTPIGRLLALCDKNVRKKEFAEEHKKFLANVNPNIRLRTPEDPPEHVDSLAALVKTLPCPSSTESIEQIKRAVKNFRVTWQPEQGKRPSLAQTYQLVAKAMGFKTWEAMVAVALTGPKKDRI